MLKFYHKNGCPACKIAQSKLDNKHIKYEDILVDPDDCNDPNFQFLSQLNITQMPVLVLEDNSILIGAKVSTWVNKQEDGYADYN